MPIRWAQVTADGTLGVPVEVLEAAGLLLGDVVVVRVEDGEVRVTSLERAIGRAQAVVRRYISPGRSLSDELIAERRDEGSRE